MLSISSTGLAEEGFSQVRPERPQLAAVWDSTFLILENQPDEYFLGSASLVQDTQANGERLLYFLTAFHVLKGSCQLGLACNKTMLFQNPKVELNGESLARLEKSNDGKFKSITLVKADPLHDLALLRVRTSVGAPTRPISVVSSCSNLKGTQAFSFGFPSVGDRTNATAKPILQSAMNLKRWSYGTVVGFLTQDKTGSFYALGDMPPRIANFMALTNDDLEGNSGGPITNGNGQLIGVVKATTATENSGYAYDPDFNMIASRCEILKQFLAK